MRLPIHRHRDEIVGALRKNNVLMIVGETGCGKSTQMARYIYEEFLAHKAMGMVAITQPRRIAAISLARQVAADMGARIGDLVGYSVRFNEKCSAKTRVKYCTDGMLLREILASPLLDHYDFICLDEIHERSTRTDLLFGLLKKIQHTRDRNGKRLGLVMMSATVNLDKFAAFFRDIELPTIRIQGRQYPVRIFYTTEPKSSYLEACISTIVQIHSEHPPGDILAFLSGQEEIETCRLRVLERIGHQEPAKILLLYSAQSMSKQQEIFRPRNPKQRRIILATNIAETSVTIPNIKYVVDSGIAKMRVYHHQLGIESLVVAPISKMSAKQRCGRAGRQCAGFCYRLYPEEAYFKLADDTVPEMRRSNMASVVLFMKAYGIDNVLDFEYIDPPPRTLLISALENLYLLKALDDHGTLTKMGRQMANFPLDPKLSRVFMQSLELGCAEEVLPIIALLSVENLFARDDENGVKLEDVRDSIGDHMTLLRIYNACVSDVSLVPKFGLNKRAFKEGICIRNQLFSLCRRVGYSVSSCGNHAETILKCFMTGFIHRNMAILHHSKTVYKTLYGQQLVQIHPTSSLFTKKPYLVLYHELVLTTKPYMRGVSRIDPIWMQTT